MDSNKPNVIFILTDDQGYWAIGKKNKDIITKNIDALCDNGVMFDNFFCASPVCSPARASILTGKLPCSHGVVDWIDSGNVDLDDLPEDLKGKGRYTNEKTAIDYLRDETLYFQFFKQKEYKMGLVGKWHLGDTLKIRDGFSEWKTILSGGCEYYDADIFSDGKIERCGEYITDFITENSIRFIEKEKDNPFYLSVNYTAPHSPWEFSQHKNEMLALYDNCEYTAFPFEKVHENQILSCPVGDTEEKRRDLIKGYYAAITALDDGIGKIVSKLKELDIYDNTIILFSSDNGMNLGQHGIWGKGNGTYPQNLYETSVKVPFILTLGERISGINIERGSINSGLYSHYDIYPTFKELLGIGGDEELIGKSFLSKLSSTTESEHDEIFIVDEYSAVRMLRTNRYKLIVDYKSNRKYLYDLKSDSGETRNLAFDTRYNEITKGLLCKMEECFNRFSNKAFDPRKLNVYGMGQNDLALEDSFSQNFQYFYKKNR